MGFRVSDILSNFHRFFNIILARSEKPFLSSTYWSWCYLCWFYGYASPIRGISTWE